MSHWRWGVLLEQVPSGGATYLDWILSGLGNTVAASLAGWALALAWGTLMGVLRTVPSRPLRALAAVYVELFRNVPLLVQFFLWYFVAPELLPERLGLWVKALPPFTQAFLATWLCLGFFTGARVCEQVRAGIEALAGGQRAAALALGFTLPQAYRTVLLPMAFRIVLPPLTSELLNILKNSAVASTINLLELAAQARQLTDYTAQAYVSFGVVTALYVGLNLVLVGLMDLLERRVRVPGFLHGRDERGAERAAAAGAP
jgi:glutamate/aspartate transport system permease protein